MNSAFETPTASLDDPFYYLTNFRFVLRWVGSRHADLLSAEERDFLLQFDTLPRESQALMVRMVMRKGELFRLTKLNYTEIGDSAVAMAPLSALGWWTAPRRLMLMSYFNNCGLPSFATYWPRTYATPG